MTSAATSPSMWKLSATSAIELVMYPTIISTKKNEMVSHIITMSPVFASKNNAIVGMRDLAIDSGWKHSRTKKARGREKRPSAIFLIVVYLARRAHAHTHTQTYTDTREIAVSRGSSSKAKRLRQRPRWIAKWGRRSSNGSFELKVKTESCWLDHAAVDNNRTMRLRVLRNPTHCTMNGVLYLSIVGLCFSMWECGLVRVCVCDVLLRVWLRV